MTKTHADKALPYRRDIDGLRAVSVLSVVAFHTFPAVCGGGFLGVDIFFIISGYLISSNLICDLSHKEWSLRKFYERRARRIFPALGLVTIVSLVAVWLFAYPNDIRSTAKHGLAGALSVENVVLWKESGYFDSASALKVFLHIWSLGVEEQFYLVWPLLLALIWIFKKYGSVIIIVLCAVSLIGTESMRAYHFNSVFYLPMFRAWELGVGALIAYLLLADVLQQKITDSLRADLIQLSGLALVGISLFVLDEKSPLPGLASIPVISGGALVIWGGAGSAGIGRLTAAILGNRVMVFVGSISYALYLWHWPLLSIPLTAGVKLDGPYKLALMVCAFALAFSSTTWLESPIRRQRNSTRSAVYSVAILAVAGALALAIYLSERSRNELQAFGWAVSDAHSTCPDQILQSTLTLSYCQVSRAGAPSAVIWGDSHADHLFPGVAKLNNLNWMLLGSSSCPPLAGQEVNANATNCRDKVRVGLNWIVAQPNIKIVVLGLFGGYFADTNVAFEHVNGSIGPATISINGHTDLEGKIEGFDRGLETSIAELIRAQKSVFIVIDVPEIPFDVKRCFSRPRIQLVAPPCTLSTRIVLERQQRLRSIITGLKDRHPSIHVIDMIQALCNDTDCPLGTIDKPIYRDSHHLSLYGSDIAAEAINAVVKTVK